MAKNQLTEEISKFGLRLRLIDGTKRTPADQNLVELVGYVEQLASRVDRLEQGE